MRAAGKGTPDASQAWSANLARVLVPTALLSTGATLNFLPISRAYIFLVDLASAVSLSSTIEDPIMKTLTPEIIPAELRDLRRWVVALIEDRNGSKLPYCAFDPSHRASVGDWSHQGE